MSRISKQADRNSRWHDQKVKSKKVDFTKLQRVKIDGRTIGDSYTLSSGLDWVIVGGESGHGARPMHPDWARSLRDQCEAAGVPFFFKQWGEWAPQSVVSESMILATQRNPSSSYSLQTDGTVDHPGRLGHTAIYKVGKKTAGRYLDGRTHDEFPKTKEVV